MVEITEVLRLWRAGVPKKRIAARLGLDPKTVRRYVSVAEGTGLRVGGDPVSETQLRDVLLALHPGGGRPRGDDWERCRAQQDAIRGWLKDGLRLTKIRKLLGRQGVVLPYPTLYRFAVLELGFGRSAPTMPVADGAPGEELQVDTGWVGWLTLIGHKRRFRAWIFTAVRSRHRFVYPTFEETTIRAIEACEAAWDYFGGIFKVLIPDNTSAIVTQADALAPRITTAFLEYAQARAFHIDPARVRHPRDKGRVERALDAILHGVDGATLTAPEAIEQLLGAQIQLRNNRRLQAAMRSSRLPAVKRLTEFDFSFQPSLRREQMESLHELGFVERRENVVFLGPPGVGKTHLAISLAIAAAQSGRRVYYGTLADLITSLEEAQAAGRLHARLKVLPHPALLVVDEIGYLPISRTGAMLFFQLMTRRYEHASTVLTSNKGFEEWGEVFGDDVMAAALIDRLVHHCHIVTIRGNSYRMRQHTELWHALLTPDPEPTSPRRRRPRQEVATT